MRRGPLLGLDHGSGIATASLSVRRHRVGDMVAYPCNPFAALLPVKRVQRIFVYATYLFARFSQLPSLRFTLVLPVVGLFFFLFTPCSNVQTSSMKSLRILSKDELRCNNNLINEP